MDTLDYIEAGNEADEAEFEMPQKANDVIREAMAQKPKPPLFDGFWQTGETALLFGASGVGKSVLAVQIADALARGTAVDGFKMPTRRHKVLYVDMTLSKVQFQRRYTPVAENGGNAKPYKFAERFYHGRPRYEEDLCSWVRSAVRTGGFEVVVIDDLTAVMRTNDGTFDSLRIMRDMKRLSCETGVSVLVLADSYPSPKGNGDVGEADLRRSRVLCGVADSVFAIGRLERGDLKLVQFRSQGSEVVWGSQNPVGCVIRRRENRLLGFVFDERFAPRLDPERCGLIHFASMCRANGFKYRDIAKVMNISKSRAERLVKAWTPAITEEVDRLDRLDCERRGVPYVHPDDEEDEYDEDLDDEYDDSEYDDDDYYDDDSEGETIDVTPVSVTDTGRKDLPWYRRIDPQKLPFASGIRPRHIHDLERDYDLNDNEIFVESREERSHRPKVWYHVGPRTGTVTRWVRDCYGSTGNHIGTSGWI
ncbi:MAG: AAA family ATPase [Acidobacteria bacterium]|nr:AAA family ATPase [Acidobacteriota bacterium]